MSSATDSVLDASTACAEKRPSSRLATTSCERVVS
jgi:hypothetical protein